MTMTIRARTTRGGDAALTSEALAGLRARLRGPILLAGDAGYEDSRTLWNAMIDRRPALVVRCLGVADVVACVNFAREHELLLSIKGGGHHIAGLAACEGGLMLDMSLMRGVWVDTRTRMAHAQPGCLLGDVDREAQLHGLAPVLGFVSNTGIAGLTLGGGFGYLTRRFGWSSDTVRSMEVVTADGRIVRASEQDHPDLFWGLRGGGGNFGIVTDFEYQLFPVGPEVMAGVMAWPIARATEVADLVRRVAEAAPLELTLVCLLRIAPPAPWLTQEVHGRPIVAVLACHSGPAEDGDRLVAPFKALGGAVGDILQRRPYVTQQNLLDATQPKGRRYYWKSEYLPAIEPALIAKSLARMERVPSPHSAIVFFQVGGALNRLPNDHSPVGNRDAAWVLNITSAWEKGEDDRANVDWARAAWEESRPFSTGGTYLNFLNEEDTGQRLHDAFGDNFDRLTLVKQSWDPTNLFRANKNIVPAGGA